MEDERSDAELVEQVRRGDESASRELWRRHWHAALATADRYRDVVDPEDAAQEGVMKVFLAVQRGAGPTGAFRPYLRRVVRNVAVSAARRRHAWAVGGLIELDRLVRDLHENPVDDVVARLEVADALRRLPRRWRDALWDGVALGIPPRELGVSYGMSANAVSALVKRAKAGMREQLSS
ncbi:RNA polymerase sigma factor [Isoptericola sp. NPDC057191]|uniref:RNA polymerase sigma factor n=1 Tax=Isoptericola sp. NPDC057191 TaxID=3346041 RepID=UPI0036417AE6